MVLMNYKTFYYLQTIKRKSFVIYHNSKYIDDPTNFSIHT